MKIRRFGLFLAFIAGLITLAPLESGAVEMGGVKLYGYADLEYTQTTGTKYNGTGPDDANLENGAFDQHHFNIVGEIPVTPKLAVKAQVEFEHGIAPGVADASVVLEYAFGEYILRDWLKLRGGKMLSPWGMYNEIHDSTPAYLTVSPPEALYKAEKMGGFAFIPKWTTGLAALGETAVPMSHNDIDYIIYLGNGESRSAINSNHHDDNSNKAVGGRLQFTTHNEWFQAGVSGYYGDKAVTRDRLDETHWTFVGQLNLNLSNLNIRGEYGYSELGRQKQDAWYTQASLRFGRFTPYARYQSLNPDLDVANDKWNMWLVGLNVKLTDFFFFKVEWDENRREKSNADFITGEAENYGEFRSALAILF